MAIIDFGSVGSIQIGTFNNIFPNQIGTVREMSTNQTYNDFYFIGNFHSLINHFLRWLLVRNSYYGYWTLINQVP